jgi:hypothetical protein
MTLIVPDEEMRSLNSIRDTGRSRCPEASLLNAFDWYPREWRESHGGPSPGGQARSLV